jgi:hypothetical protein
MGRIKYSCNFLITKPEGVFSETPNSFKALTLMAPMSHMVATTSSPACIGFRATFQEGESQHFFFYAPPPALWLMPDVPIK